MDAPIDWLLEGEPWIEYRTRRDLLGQSEKDPQVESARKSMLANAQVQNLVAELSDIEKQGGSARVLYSRISLECVEGLGIWAEERTISVVNPVGLAHHWESGECLNVVQPGNADHTRSSPGTPGDPGIRSRSSRLAHRLPSVAVQA